MVTQHDGTPVHEIAKLVRVSGSVSVPHRIAPRLGEHTDEVLTQLGCTGPALTDMRRRSVIR